MSKIIDLSQKLTNQTNPYPGDEKLVIKKDKAYNKDGYTLHTLTSNMHQGTHIDAPMHLSSDLVYISEYDLNHFYGKANLVNASNKAVIGWDESYDELITESIVLIYTGFDKYYKEESYFTKHPILTEEFIKHLIEKKIKTIGIDFPSPDYEPYKIHEKLFKNKICIIENLTNLDKLLHVNQFIFSALPLNIEAEASLTRAVAIL